ncbi:hypothetical protein GCM10017778_52060 [Streptomyces vinaceus]|nr:hypothetical protein GCM10017778_52060 [Streptomyces vinaceus]
MVAVVRGLLDGLRRERGERTVADGQFRVQLVLVEGEVELAGDGVGEVPVRLLDQLEVAEGALLAQEGQLVLVAGQGQQDAGLAEQVERDVREGDLLLQDGGVARPLAEAVGEDQRVVPEREGRAAGDLGGSGIGAGHRWCTPSGIS